MPLTRTIGAHDNNDGRLSTLGIVSSEPHTTLFFVALHA